MLDDVRQHAGNHDAAPAAVQSKPSAQYATEKLVGKYRGSCRNVTARQLLHVCCPSEKFA